MDHAARCIFGSVLQAHGRRIQRMAEFGSRPTEIAFALGVSVDSVQLCIAHMNGEPLPGDPTPEEIAEECRRIRAGEVVIVSGYQSRPPKVESGVPRQRGTRVRGQHIQSRA